MDHTKKIILIDPAVLERMQNRGENQSNITNSLRSRDERNFRTEQYS